MISGGELFDYIVKNKKYLYLIIRLEEVEACKLF